MANNPRDRSLGATTVRGMRSTVGRESTTFGFSILVTATFGLLQHVQGSPDVARTFLYAVGAVMSFTLLEGVLSKGFRNPMPQHHTRTLTLGTSGNVVSVSLGLLAAWGFAEIVGGIVVWPLAPFIAATVYLLVESLEAAAAERVHLARGYPDADEVSP